MREMRITFTDAEFNVLKKARLEYSKTSGWRAFILSLCKKQFEGGKRNE